MQIGSKCVLYMSMKYKNGWETTQPQRKKKHMHTPLTPAAHACCAVLV